MGATARKTKAPATEPTYAVPKGICAAELHHVDPFKLHVDPDYQRQLNGLMVRAMVDHFDPELFGVVEVNWREVEDELFVIDGQHRVHVARIKKLPAVPVRMHFGLTREQEAKMFVAFQRSRRSVTPLDAFRARLFAKDPEAVAIDALLDEMGWRIKGQGGSGDNRDTLQRAIASVGTVERIYRFNQGMAEGALLTRTLSIYERAWSATTGAVQAQVLQGLAYLLSRKGEMILDADLIRKLQMREPADILRTVRSNAGAMGGSTKIAQIALHMLTIYNRGRRKNVVDGSDLLDRASAGESILPSGKRVVQDLSADSRGMSSSAPRLMEEDADREAPVLEALDEAGDEFPGQK